MTWQEAKLVCELAGGHLACVETIEENVFLIEFAAKRRGWLGATDEEQEGKWKWVNGSDSAFKGWSPGEPSDRTGNENYAVIQASGGWNDVNSRPQKNLGFFCEWE